MAISFPMPRSAAMALAVLAFAAVADARAEDPPAPQPSAASSGQKAGGARAGATTPASPAAAEQHRLPPDSTTKQTLALAGRPGRNDRDSQATSTPDLT